MIKQFIRVSVWCHQVFQFCHTSKLLLTSEITWCLQWHDHCSVSEWTRYALRPSAPLTCLWLLTDPLTKSSESGCTFTSRPPDYVLGSVIFREMPIHVSVVCYTVCVWLEPRMQGADCKSHPEFRLCRGSAPLSPELIKGQLYANQCFWGIFTGFCSHHQNLFLEYLCPPSKKLHAHQHSLSPHFWCQPWAVGSPLLCLWASLSWTSHVRAAWRHAGSVALTTRVMDGW